MTSPSFEVKRPTTGTGGDWPTGECWMTAGNPYKQHKVRATSPPPPSTLGVAGCIPHSGAQTQMPLPLVRAAGQARVQCHWDTAVCKYFCIFTGPETSVMRTLSFGHMRKSSFSLLSSQHYAPPPPPLE